MTSPLNERKYSHPSNSVPYLRIFNNKYVFVLERCCPRCVSVIVGVVVLSAGLQ